jgi:hypothetical protein
MMTGPRHEGVYLGQSGDSPNGSLWKIGAATTSLIPA